MTDKRPMVRTVRTFMHKHPRRDRGMASLMAILGPIALLLMVALVPIHVGSRAAMAAQSGPLIVGGTIYSLGGAPVVGANVLVSLFNDTTPAGSLLTSSISDGSYTVTFGPNTWDYGFTIVVIANDGSNGGQNSTVVSSDFPTIDVKLGTTIPELGGPAVTALTVCAIGMMVVLYARRRGPGSP